LLAGLKDCLLVFPSWGVDYCGSEGIDETIHEYIHDCLAHISEHLGITPAQPWLLAVSAGGSVGSRLVSCHASSYAVYISLSSSLGAADVGPGYPVLSLHGMQDQCYPCEAEARHCQARRGTGARAKCKVWSPASHWLLLSHRREIGQTIRGFAGCGLAPAE
jgi:pimeloyl-ACP methyl ester carboxylesterase